MNETDENVQRRKKQTPRRLGLGLRSPRNFPTQKTPSISKTPVKLFLSPVIDESTTTKKRKIYSDTSDVKKGIKCSSTKLEPETLSSSNIPMDERSIVEIKISITQMECRLAKYEKYEKRTNGLAKMIETWRAGGQAALQILQDAISPKQELAVILKHLNLPENIFNVKQIE